MSAAVRLHYVRSGGLANLRKEATVDTSELRQSDPAAADRLESAVAAALAEGASAAPSSRADGFQYALELTRAGATTRLVAHDPVQAGALGELLKLLAPLSKIAR